MDKEIFVCKDDLGNYGEATYNDTTNKMTVFKGAKFNSAEFKLNDEQDRRTSYKIRGILLKNNDLITEGNHYILQNDVYLSPSAASTQVLGKLSNGRNDWKCKKTGQTINEIYGRRKKKSKN